MTDIALVLKDNCFDLEIENGDLKVDEGLETAISISLFTDQRVTDEELQYGHDSKRGWWGDLYPEVDQDQIGSKLWLLEREKSTNEVRVKAEDYCRQALDWLLEDGVADSVNVSGSYESTGYLVLNIEILRPEGETRYSVLWDKQEVIRRI